MGVHLFARWLYFFCVTVIASAAVDLYDSLGAAVIVLAGLLTLLFAIVYMLLTERAAAGRGGLRPLYCSIYEQPFWRHERYWKITTPTEATPSSTAPLTRASSGDCSAPGSAAMYSTTGASSPNAPSSPSATTAP